MPVLTPSERRGALVLLALCALGACWDLLHASPASAPPASATAAGPAVHLPAGIAAAPAAAVLDLNLATAEQLDALPGIGPVLASRIVEHRRSAGPFRSADELLAVRGIGERLLGRLRPLLTVRTLPAAGARETLQIAMPSRR